MPAPAERSFSLLVVDDDPLVLQAVRRVLQRGGHRVATAGSAEQGLTLLRTQCFDAALVDWYMPGAGGRGFVLGAADEAPGLPVLLMSGSVGVMAGLTGGLGHLTVVPKPWSSHELLAAVSATVGRTSVPVRQALHALGAA